MFEWQKDLVDALGGFDKLEKYRTTFGDEFGAKNPFHTGQVAMAIDGEWRAGMIDDAGVDFDYGVAPFPVPDDQADTYGKGYLSGTIIGIASTSEKQNAAWELVKYLTTDTDAVVSFANAIHNVPSTMDALKSPDLDQMTRTSRPSSRSPRTRTATPRRPARTAAPTSSPCRTSATPTSRARRPTFRPRLDKTDTQIDKPTSSRLRDEPQR